ncbi:WGR domain-containing protein [Thalassobaculum litoreum]|uniref:WGR domain-containing protein n=1 Tax=Thalassobaculum litoreum TaxID=420996 RepID=UPI000B80455D|nr:WGR domain-containing protein [Thalassobaculum litoreum]
MLSLTYLRLRLVDPEHNRNRVYELEIDRDLFGEITVTKRFGRYGSRLRGFVASARDLEDANRIAAGDLRRRLTARRRLGSAYVLMSAAGDCAPLVRRWQEAGGADRRARDA